MANTLLTVDQITREALRILHQKLNFIGSINRQYDASFAQDGAKIGSTLRIRLPNEYTVSTGATLVKQDTTEQNTSLTVSTQKHVGMNFTSVDLTLSLDDFSKRIITPAMSVLASAIEADAFSMYKDVYQQVNGMGSAQTFANILNAGRLLTDALTPEDDDRYIRLNTRDNVDLVDSLKGLFQSSSEVSKQYTKGVMGTAAGFEFAQNTLIPRHQRGAGSGYLVNGASQTGSSLIVDTGTGALSKGDVFTIANVFKVHPETKQTQSELQQFVVTADYAGGAGTISISPAIVTSGARQNVSAGPADNAAITVAGTASTAHGLSLAYHKDAFTFATADLVMPKGVDMASRQVFDGISMRLVRQYDINDDVMPTRIDVLYGYKTLRPQLAARIAAN